MPKLHMISMCMAILASMILVGCVNAPKIQNQTMMRGFNALQDDKVAWNSLNAHHSIKQMASSGANAVVFVSFLKQPSPGSVMVQESDAVTQVQLKSAISYARSIGLKVILKPQMLVSGSWAGGITHANPQQWHAWFESYSRQIIDLAVFAAAEHVDAFVIGTELFRANGHVDWSILIRAVRSVYHGQISYAAHNVDGLRAFRYWSQLDAVALTLYPSLGSSGAKDELQRSIDDAVKSLHVSVQGIGKPLWVMEVGMPSAQGASEKPWEWHGLRSARVDLTLQKSTLDLWIKALDKTWVDGVFIWAWYSDRDSGGRRDADYTPQNKPAEHVIRNYWK